MCVVTIQVIILSSVPLKLEIHNHFYDINVQDLHQERKWENSAMSIRWGIIKNMYYRKLKGL